MKKQTTTNPTRTRSLLVAVCLGLFDLMAMTAQAGDTTEQPIKQLNEASDLIHWPEGFSPKQTDAGAGAIQSVPRPGCDEALPLKLWSLVAQDLVVRSLQV